MRKYTEIYQDYCNFLVEKTGDDNYQYEAFIDSFEDEKTAHSFLFKNILKLCYRPKDGLYYFCKFILGDLKHIGYPNKFRFNMLLRKWDKLVKNNKKVCIMSARGHGKTVCFSEVLNIYDTFLFKYRRIIIISASQEQANRILGEIKTIVDNNEWLKTKKDPLRWAAETIGYNNGYIIAKGIGSEILGEHVDRIVLDDILQTLDTGKKISDQAIEDYIDMTLDPMLLNRKGQMIIVGTPKSSGDIFTTIARRVKRGSVWVLKRFPAILDFDNEILQCPDRFSWRDIIDKRLSMGPLKFAREYQLEFFSRDTSLFPRHLIEPAKRRGEDFRLLNIMDKRDRNWSFVVGVDVARSGAVSADYTVAIILAYNAIDQTKQIVHMWRSKGLKIREQAEHLAILSKKFNHPCFVVETNNMGQDMVDELVDKHNLYVEQFTTTNKSKDELIRFLITAFEYEQLIIPQGDEESRKQIEVLEDELAKYCVSYTPTGLEKFEGLGSHDDTVVALALANKGTQMAGVPFFVGMGSGTKIENFDAFINKTGKETDLVQKIRMGIIK